MSALVQHVTKFDTSTKFDRSNKFEVARSALAMCVQVHLLQENGVDRTFTRRYILILSGNVSEV